MPRLHLELRINRKPGSQGLNPDQVAQALTRDFPEAAVCLEDKLASQAERAAQLFTGAAVESRGQVLQTLRRNASQAGPQYSFTLAFPGQTIKGYVQKYVIVFLYEEPLDQRAEARLLKFLRSFRTGAVKKTSSDGRVEEVPRQA